MRLSMEDLRISTGFEPSQHPRHSMYSYLSIGVVVWGVHRAAPIYAIYIFISFIYASPMECVIVYGLSLLLGRRVSSIRPPRPGCPPALSSVSCRNVAGHRWSGWGVARWERWKGEVALRSSRPLFFEIFVHDLLS